ncbi:isochorismatase family protein [Zhihengliuella flava]|uniref:nicotinamidase n=1 Tax=Zhihengliuella flava TaxID=1285193 RepID=A0A931D4K4_9MICC|nr:nicotinamidase/pyrazinamidase [Zhihengliuella flava]
MADALIIVDVQYDFCPGGALGVEGGDDIATRIVHHVEAEDYDYVVATQDWHIEPGSHFSDDPDWVHSWPVHCVAGSHGAALHAHLDPLAEVLDGVFRKGEYTAAYSGFEGRLALAEGAQPGSGPDASPTPLLADWLRERHVDEVRVVGIATDYCVRATVLDAVRAGFRTAVVPALTAAVVPDNVPGVLSEWREAGVEIHG